ncbi:hypothetical protein [Streptomyces sp. NPDC058572]
MTSRNDKQFCHRKCKIAGYAKASPRFRNDDSRYPLHAAHQR